MRCRALCSDIAFTQAQLLAESYVIQDALIEHLTASPPPSPSISTDRGRFLFFQRSIGLRRNAEYHPRRLVAGGEGVLTVLTELLNEERVADARPHHAVFSKTVLRPPTPENQLVAGPLRITSLHWLSHLENRFLVGYLFHGIQ